MTNQGLFDSSIESRFRRFHAQNPHVYQMFKQFTIEAISKGRQKIGAKMIAERIRWYSEVESSGDQFKLNNNFVSRYVRMLEREDPRLVSVFERRSLKA